jgi:hypothetical protein
MSNRAIYVTTLLVIVLIGFAVRLHHLDRPMKTDEATNYLNFMTRPVSFIISDYSDANNHVLHTLLSKALLQIGGNQPMVFRLPAFIAGVLLIPATALLALRIYKQPASLLAATFVAVSGALIDFSVNNRGYTMVALIVLVLFLLAHHLKQHDDWRAWTAFAVLSALGFYTIPLTVYAMGGIALWLVISIWLENQGEQRAYLRRRLLRNCVFALAVGGALTVLLYSPILMGDGFRVINGEGGYTEGTSTSWLGLLATMPRRNLRFFYQGLPSVFRYATVLLPLLGLIGHWRISKDRVPLVVPTVLWIYAMLIAMWLIPGRRTWVIIIPLFYLYMGAGASLLLQLLKVKLPIVAGGAVLLALLLGLSLYEGPVLAQNSQLNDADDVEEAALQLGELVQEGDQVLYAVYSYSPLFYYLDKHDIPNRVLIEAELGEVDFGGEGEIYAFVYPEGDVTNQLLQDEFNLDPAALEFNPIASYKLWQLVEVVPSEANG